MKKDRPQGESEKQLVADPASCKEAEDLEDFCKSVLIEEISFEHWCQHHHKLDLQFPISIARSQLGQAFKKVIRLSRSIIQTDAKKRIEKREKFEYEISLDPACEMPKVLVIKGLGDRLDNQSGDLCIIITVID